MRILSWCRLPFGCLLAFAAWPYLLVPAYRFPEPAPFRGAAWYNPYADTSGTWRTANFHAHSKAWGGLTHGRLAPDTVRVRYAALGYDIAPVTNYFSTDTTGGAIATYEHGLNVFKSHRLVIGADRVDWLDFALGQTRAHKQYVLDRLSRDGVVAIPHAYMRDGHSEADLQALTGYTLLEVMSHFGSAERHWDAALSAGRPIWAIANDDTHDADDPGQTGVRWTLVRSAGTSREAVLDALRAGRTIAVAGRLGRVPVTVRRVTMRGDTLAVDLDRPVARIDFIGSEGRRMATAAGVSRARHIARPDDPYIRVVVHADDATLLLNPVIRTDAGIPRVPVAAFDAPRTWGMRALLAVVGLLATARLVRPRRRRRLVPLPAPVPAAALRRAA